MRFRGALLLLLLVASSFATNRSYQKNKLSSLKRPIHRAATQAKSMSSQRSSSGKSSTTSAQTTEAAAGSTLSFSSGSFSSGGSSSTFTSSGLQTASGEVDFEDDSDVQISTGGSSSSTTTTSTTSGVQTAGSGATSSSTSSSGGSSATFTTGDKKTASGSVDLDDDDLDFSGELDTSTDAGSSSSTSSGSSSSSQISSQGSSASGASGSSSSSSNKSSSGSGAETADNRTGGSAANSERSESGDGDKGNANGPEKSNSGSKGKGHDKNQPASEKSSQQASSSSQQTDNEKSISSSTSSSESQPDRDDEEPEEPAPPFKAVKNQVCSDGFNFDFTVYQRSDAKKIEVAAGLAAKASVPDFVSSYLHDKLSLTTVADAASALKQHKEFTVPRNTLHTRSRFIHFPLSTAKPILFHFLTSYFIHTVDLIDAIELFKEVQRCDNGFVGRDFFVAPVVLGGRSVLSRVELLVVKCSDSSKIELFIHTGTARANFEGKSAAESSAKFDSRSTSVSQSADPLLRARIYLQAVKFFVSS